MSILNILTIPNPILKQVSLPVEKIDDKIKTLINNMRETMLVSTHCVGIAAVQVGILSRIILVDVSLNLKPHHNNGLLITILSSAVFCFVCLGMVFLFPTKQQTNLKGSSTNLNNCYDWHEDIEQQLSLFVDKLYDFYN